MLHYIAMTKDGEILGLENTVEDAVRLSTELMPDTTIQVDEIEEFDLTRNPGLQPLALTSLKHCGVPPIDPSAATMSLDEAHQRLLPYFADMKLKGDKAVKTYNSPRGMLKAWLGQNYKTEKSHPEQPSNVMGLTLVPAQQPLLASVGKGPYQFLRDNAKYRKDGLRMIDRWSGQLPARTPQTRNFCVGSNPQCRDSCLVFAGRNASAVYNTYRKVAQSMALLNEPEAFARMLSGAVAMHGCTSPVEGFAPYTRLNVLSDIPWELVAPWLFDLHPSMSFYDYTKVDGRELPENYHLTFSFSGDKKNYQRCIRELADGRSVACVFLGHKLAGKKGKWKAFFPRNPIENIPLPPRMVFGEGWDLPIVDGDISDVRPLDVLQGPGPHIVGLRWKSPSGARSGADVDPDEPNFNFVTSVYVLDGKGYLIDDLPVRNPSDAKYLVAAVTPRFQPIKHDEGLP